MLIVWILSLAKFCNRKFDIYKDPAPSEVIAAIPVLTTLRERVAELLQEWPDHPILKQVCCEEFTLITSRLCWSSLQIIVAVDKVLSSSVSDPLMKILGGLEYIMQRAQVSVHVM